MIDGYYRCSLKFEIPEKGLSCTRYGVLRMYEDEGQLKGNMFPTYYWLPAAFRRGKVDGNKFSFTVFFSTPCQQFAMEVEGETDGQTVHGIARNAAGFEGPYVLSGTRIPDSEAETFDFNR